MTGDVSAHSWYVGPRPDGDHEIAASPPFFIENVTVFTPAPGRARTKRLSAGMPHAAHFFSKNGCALPIEADEVAYCDAPRPESRKA